MPEKDQSPLQLDDELGSLVTKRIHRHQAVADWGLGLTAGCVWGFSGSMVKLLLSFAALEMTHLAVFGGASILFLIPWLSIHRLHAQPLQSWLIVGLGLLTTAATVAIVGVAEFYWPMGHPDPEFAEAYAVVHLVIYVVLTLQLVTLVHWRFAWHWTNLLRRFTQEAPSKLVLRNRQGRPLEASAARVFHRWCPVALGTLFLWSTTGPIIA